MIHAYQEIYLSKAQAVLGDVFDYAVNVCEIDGSIFTKLFVCSSVSKRMEKGEAAYLAGKSGIEIVEEVLKETTGENVHIEVQEHMGRSSAYWIGWAVAYYQWHSDRSYGEIFQAIPYDDLQSVYNTLHEADVTKFVDLAERRMRECFPETNLKRIRTFYGCSQSELAKGADVSLRSIQMYEQRNKDINKANIETIYKLAKYLGCSMEDLIEK